MDAVFRSGAKTVLVVDDDLRIVDILVRLMELRGYRALAASGGTDALAVMETERVDLVILDLMLPDTPGEQVCKEIRGKENLSHIPIIMLSGKTGEADRIVGKVIGADCYLTKPLNLHDLLVQVERFTGS